MRAKKIIESAKIQIRNEIRYNANYIYYSLHKKYAEEGDELSIEEITDKTECRFAVEEIRYLDGRLPYSVGTHYIWKIKFLTDGKIAFCYPDDKGEIPFEPSVEELGRLCELCEEKVHKNRL